MKIARKNAEPKKDEMIRVRVTHEEHELFFKMAAAKGYTSISDFIRSLIAEENEKEQGLKK